jgi:hypothetical protein
MASHIGAVFSIFMIVLWIVVLSLTKPFLTLRTMEHENQLHLIPVFPPVVVCAIHFKMCCPHYACRCCYRVSPINGLSIWFSLESLVHNWCIDDISQKRELMVLASATLPLHWSQIGEISANHRIGPSNYSQHWWTHGPTFESLRCYDFWTQRFSWMCSASLLSNGILRDRFQFNLSSSWFLRNPTAVLVFFLNHQMYLNVNRNWYNQQQVFVESQTSKESLQCSLNWATHFKP